MNRTFTRNCDRFYLGVNFGYIDSGGIPSNKYELENRTMDIIGTLSEDSSTVSFYGKYIPETSSIPLKC